MARTEPEKFSGSGSYVWVRPPALMIGDGIRKMTPVEMQLKSK